MALSTEELLKLKTAEHRATLRDLLLSMELLEYYRDIAPSMVEDTIPPPNYWIKELGSGCGWGILRRGHIVPKGKKASVEEAIAACWAHLEEIKPRHIKQKEKPSTAHLDLDDLLADAPETNKPKSRRRRIVE